MDDQKTPGNQGEEQGSEFPDFYARYKNGVHEVTAGVRAPNESRFIYLVAAIALAGTGAGLAIFGQVLLGAVLLGPLLLTVLRSAWLVQNADGANSKKSADKPTNIGNRTDSEDST